MTESEYEAKLRAYEAAHKAWMDSTIFCPLEQCKAKDVLRVARAEYLAARDEFYQEPVKAI